MGKGDVSTMAFSVVCVGGMHICVCLCFSEHAGGNGWLTFSLSILGEAGGFGERMKTAC